MSAGNLMSQAELDAATEAAAQEAAIAAQQAERDAYNEFAAQHLGGAVNEQLDDTAPLAEPDKGHGGAEDMRRKSKQAMDIDHYSTFRAKRIVKGLKQAHKDATEAAQEAIDNGEDATIPAPMPELDKQEVIRVAADIHSALFEPSPRLAERPDDEAGLRQEWLATLLDSAEFGAVRGQTVLRDFCAEIVAPGLIRECCAWVEKRRESQDPDSIGDEIARNRSAEQACQRARREAQAVGDVIHSLGTLDGAKLKEYFSQVRGNQMLRRIMEFAGRYRVFASGKQRTKTVHGMDDVVGIALGGEIERLIPAELLALAMPHTQADALRRLVERQAMVTQYSGSVKQVRGPIVVCVDESGSMSGDQICKAKAIALTMAWIARQQKRWIALYGFCDRLVSGIAMPPTRWDQRKLLDWCGAFAGGGTTLHGPCHEVPFEKWPELLALGMPRGKTDLIIITDAGLTAPSDLVRDFLAFKAAEKVTCFGVVLDSSPGDMEKVCNRSWCVGDLEIGNEAIGEIFSV